MFPISFKNEPAIRFKNTFLKKTCGSVLAFLKTNCQFILESFGKVYLDFRCVIKYKGQTKPLSDTSDYRGGSGGSLEPLSAPPPRFFLISYENEIIWSQGDQFISLSWDI